MGTKNKRRKIQSDETLLDIIEYLESNGPAGVTEIAKNIGSSKGTVHAHLASLEDRRFVVNDNGSYRLGLEFFNYGQSVQLAHQMYPMVNEKLDQLVSRTGERAWCHVEENGLIYYLCGAEGKHPVQPPVRIGRCVNAHTIAGGKAILAHLPEHRVREIVDQYGLPAETEYTITDEEELFAELQEIRDRGFAFNKEESLKGLHAVGAPILDEDGVALASFSISGPANRLKGEKLERDVPELLLGVTNELEIIIAHS